MPRRCAYDHGEDITTLELLSAVHEHGPGMGSALDHYQAEALSQALGREFLAGHLVTAARLSGRGQRRLEELRSTAPPS